MITYRLTAVYDYPDQDSGLPSITSHLIEETVDGGEGLDTPLAVAVAQGPSSKKVVGTRREEVARRELAKIHNNLGEEE